MIKNFTELLNEKNWVVTGRASTAIYLILKSNNIMNSAVLIPSNICYAAVYPIIFSNNIPVFMDISDDGNINLKSIIDSYTYNVKSIVLPHMYGNPIEDIEEICKFCNEKGILVIEDCASSMGASINNRITGDFGDYSIFSFGYAKTIDLGNGGLVVTSRKIEPIYNLQQELPFYNELISEKLAFFSQLYRIIRNNKENDFIRKIYLEIPNYYKDAFLYNVKEEFKEDIVKSISNLDEIIKTRKMKNKIYKENLKINKFVNIFKNVENGVPWRFNILVESCIKKNIVKYLLENNVPVSDWYPSVAPIFGVSNIFINTNKMENEILNFPLMIEDNEIIKICNIFNKYFLKV